MDEVPSDGSNGEDKIGGLMKILAYGTGGRTDLKSRQHPWVPGTVFLHHPGLLGLLQLIEKLEVSDADQLRALLHDKAVD